MVHSSSTVRQGGGARVSSRRCMSARLVLVAMIITGAMAQIPTANASFPGQNGRLLHECRLVDNGASHSELCTTKPDGSGQRFLTDTRSPRMYWEPAWSPDG